MTKVMHHGSGHNERILVGVIAPLTEPGWRVFADFLLKEGCTRIAVASAKSIYWAAGIEILRTQFEAVGGNVLDLDTSGLSPTELCDRLVAAKPSALLLLVGATEPLASIVQSVRQDSRLSGLLIGAPAGQPELSKVHEILRTQGTGIPFLRYLPDHLSEEGSRVMGHLHKQLGEQPSFVALEGYDAAKVTAELIKLRNSGVAIRDVWRNISVEGSRGLIRFSQVPGINVWQWADAPVQVADRDPADPESFRVRKVYTRHGTH